MSWNSSIQFNNLYRAYLSLSVSAIVNPLANDMNANNKNITNVNTITSTTCATQTLTANTFNGSVLGGNTTSASYYIGASSIPLLYLTNVNNIAIGNNTLNAISSSSPQANIAIGTDALRYGQPLATLGIGYQALTLSDGQFCVGLGHLAGSTHTTGTGCTYIGGATTASAASVANEMALGYQAAGKGNNTIQLGNASATTLYTPPTVRSNTGTLTLNSQGGALNLQSAGTTYASVDANGITSANFNGKISVVGATNNSGNLVLCNNTTNTTGNFDLLTDSNQNLKFTATNNVLTVGGATTGSIVVPSTAGFITAPTLTGGNVSITGGGSLARIGSNSLVSDSGGAANNMSIGIGVGRTAGTGSFNLLNGISVGQSMTTGQNNCVIGISSCNLMTTGQDNCVFGVNTGNALTTGFSEVLIGQNSGRNMTTGAGNTLIGKDAGRTITIGDWNTAVGERALDNVLANANTGIYNTAIGHYTCPQLTSAFYNTAVGSFAGTFLTTGQHNIYIGYNSLASGTGNSNGEYVIGDNTTGKGTSSAIIKVGDNNFWLSGFGGGTLQTSASGQVSRVSDRNLKNNITYLSNAGSTSRILALKPCTYELKQDDKPHTYKGFIAQDVMEILPSAVDGKKHRFQFEKNVDGSPKRDEEGNIIYMKDENGNPQPRYLGLNTTDILAEAVLAIQEQQTEITDLKAQVASLKALVESLASRIA